jgi:hypothetical protein
MRTLCVLLLAVVPAAAEDYDPTEILMRLRDHVLAHGRQIPNHTCVETITRDVFEAAVQPVPKSCDSLLARRTSPNFPALLRHATTDRLRLDVALAEGREIYSWAGARKFEEGEIDELIPDGAMGTGPFATMLLSVFRGRVPRFTYEGQTTLDHRLVFEYSFRIPQEESRYRIKAGTDWVITGYTGTLWVDVKSAELVRLAVRTDELPAATQSCETQTTLDYNMVKLGTIAYLLPVATRQRFISRDGSEAENRIEFASCREYRGESKVSFAGGIADLSTPEEGRRVAPASFEAGLPVTVDLENAIHSNRAAAGDVIQGRLAAPIGKVVPAGAALTGRLMRVEIRHGSRPEVVIALRWETIELQGMPAPIALLPSRKLADLKTVTERVVLARRGVEIELPPESDRLHGVYRFPGRQVVVERGFRTEWKTLR